MQMSKILKAAVPYSFAQVGVPASQLYRWKLSRMDAIKRKLRFYIRTGQKLPSAEKLAAVLFYNVENSIVSPAELIISEAIRRGLPRDESK